MRSVRSRTVSTTRMARIGCRAERYRAARLFQGLVTLGLASGLTHCAGTDSVAGYTLTTDPTKLYSRLTLDYPAITLSTVAPYNTLQLTATPRDALGNAMVGLPAPVYSSSDSANVQVTAEGLVTALGPVTEAKVIATLTIPGPIRQSDTAIVSVTDLADPPKLARLSIHPPSSDSTIIPTVLSFDCVIIHDIANIRSTQFWQLTPIAVDAEGKSIEGLPVEYTSLDPNVLPVERHRGFIASQSSPTGQARLVARTTAYGITKADTVTYTLTLPFCASTSIRSTPDVPTSGFFFDTYNGSVTAYSPIDEIKIVAGGVVVWLNYTSDTVDVTFDDPANAAEPWPNLCDAFVVLGGGCTGAGSLHVPPAPPGDRFITGRQFHVPGVYPFHSTHLGASGRVIVTAGPESTISGPQ